MHFMEILHVFLYMGGERNDLVFQAFKRMRQGKSYALALYSFLKW